MPLDFEKRPIPAKDKTLLMPKNEHTIELIKFACKV